jgi:hypothetical protein
MHACSNSNPLPWILSSCEALAKFIIGCEESSLAAVPPVSDDALLLTVVQKGNTTMNTAKVQRESHNTTINRAMIQRF